jgi:phage terminase large subunit-like protein
MIPKDKIVNYTSKSGVSGGIDKLYIRHVSGGLSCLQFKAYKQSNESFYGTAMDWIWLDELPNEAIFSECFTRTMTTGGIVCVTATPLAGMTPLVYSFYSEADFLPAGFQIPNTIRMAKEDLERKNDEARQKGEQVVDGRGKKVVVCIGWDDALWLSENEKIEQLASTPPHLRQAKSTGIPGDTGGMVFPIAMSELLVDDFPIPAHYKLINGLDPGWHNTGAIFCALDPDTDTLYVYADYKRGQAEIVVHAEAIKTKSKWADAPVIWDYAGMGGRAEEESTRNLYRKHGLKLINADKSVMAGIAAVWERMSTGKLKIFKSCRTLQQELATYQMDEKGNIVKENDHCVDPLKYVSLATKHARAPHQGIGSSFGVMKGQVGGKKYFG